VDIIELDQESAELLPDRQALGRWGWDGCHSWNSWHHCWNGWQSCHSWNNGWSHCS
jgi:hypothetical protein